MPAFVTLGMPAPIDQFASVMKHGRASLKELYDIAFAAARRRNESLNLMYQAEFSHLQQDNIFGVEWLAAPVIQENPEPHRLEAYGQDVGADIVASAVLLTADNALQALGKSFIGGLTLSNGFGPVYNSVPLTSLLHATTNALRHTHDWFNNERLKLPYSDSDKEDLGQSRRSIEILATAFGMWKHERSDRPPCFGALALIDGKFDTQPTDYNRFESAVISAGRDIVEAGDADQLAAFDARFHVLT
jgi:hypothetical protein